MINLEITIHSKIITMDLQGSRDIAGRLKHRFPDIYRVVLGFLEPSIIHVILDLIKDVNVIHELFIEACVEGNLEVVKYFVFNGVDVTIENNIALRRATDNDHLEVIKYLVSQGADFRAAFNYVLRIITTKGHLDVIKFLVSKGADLNFSQGLILNIAAMNNHLHVVKYLVEQGIDFSSNDYGAIRWASSRGYKEVVKYLKSKLPRALSRLY